MNCPRCNQSYEKLMRHIQNAHPGLYEEQQQKALELFKNGSTLREISIQTLWSFGSGLSKLISSNFTATELQQSKAVKIQTSLKNGYTQNKYNTKGRGRKKKMTSKLKTTSKKWDNSIPLDFPATTNISTKLNAPPDEILEWKGNRLTNKYLRTLDEDQRDEIAKDLLNYFMQYDINNLKPNDTVIKKDYENLKNSNISILNNNGTLTVDNRISTGNKIIRRFFSNLYEVKSDGRDSVVDIVGNKEKLWKVIRNRIGNTLMFCDTATGSVRQRKGEKVCCDECPATGARHQYPMNINSRMVMVQGSKASGGAAHASVFKGGVAKAIYELYVKDGDKVLDYSCGFGMRMLGLFCSGKKDVSYYGYEPNQKTYDGLYEAAKFFGFENRISIKKCGSEEQTFRENMMDFSFSSPPYFTAEIYSTDVSDKQCYNTYSDYDEWLEKYWRVTVKNIKIMLKPGAVLGANVGNDANVFMSKLKNDMTKIIEEEGFELIETIQMVTSRSHLTNKLKTQNTFKHEPIFFYKNVK